MGANPMYEPSVAQLVDVLNNSRLGKTKHDTGWDLSPYSIRVNKKSDIIYKAFGIVDHFN